MRPRAAWRAPPGRRAVPFSSHRLTLPTGSHRVSLEHMFSQVTLHPRPNGMSMACRAVPLWSTRYLRWVASGASTSPGRWGAPTWPWRRSALLDAEDDLGGLDEHGDGLALGQAEALGRGSGDGRHDLLAGDVDGDLGHDRAELDVADGAAELVTGAELHLDLLWSVDEGMVGESIQADAAQPPVARADQRVGGGVVPLVPAAADLVEPAAAGGVAGHVPGGLDRLDGDHPDQAEGQVVGPDRGTGGEQPDPLAGLLEQERDRPQPVADERPGAPAVGLPGPVEEADEVGVVEPLQAVQGGGELVVQDQSAALVGVAGGLDRGLGQAVVGRLDVADRPELHLLQWHGRPPVAVRRGRR